MTSSQTPGAVTVVGSIGKDSPWGSRISRGLLPAFRCYFFYLRNTKPSPCQLESRVMSRAHYIFGFLCVIRSGVPESAPAVLRSRVRRERGVYNWTRPEGQSGPAAQGRSADGLRPKGPLGVGRFKREWAPRKAGIYPTHSPVSEHLPMTALLSLGNPAGRTVRHGMKTFKLPSSKVISSSPRRRPK